MARDEVRFRENIKPKQRAGFDCAATLPGRPICSLEIRHDVLFAVAIKSRNIAYRLAVRAGDIPTRNGEFFR